MNEDFFFHPLLSLGRISVSVLSCSPSNFQQRGHLGREMVFASPTGSAHGRQAATLGRDFNTTLRTRVPTSSMQQQKPKEMQHLAIFWPSMWSQLWWGLAYGLAFHRPFTLCDSVTFSFEWQRWVVASALPQLPGLAVRWCVRESPCGLLPGWTVCARFLISAGLSHTPRMNVAAWVSIHLLQCLIMKTSSNELTLAFVWDTQYYPCLRQGIQSLEGVSQNRFACDQLKVVNLLKTFWGFFYLFLYLLACLLVFDNSAELYK